MPTPARAHCQPPIVLHLAPLLLGEDECTAVDSTIDRKADSFEVVGQTSTQVSLQDPHYMPPEHAQDAKTSKHVEPHEGFSGDASQVDFGEPFKLHLGTDVFDDTHGLCTQWDMPDPKNLTELLDEIPPYYPEQLIQPQGKAAREYQYIHIFTDGSAKWQHNDKQSSWACIIFGASSPEPLDDQLQLIDWYAAPTQDDPLHPAWLGAEESSSRSGEAEAIAWAVLWALQENIARPIHLHSDATSVLYGATGQWTHRIGDQLLRRVRALYHLYYGL